MSKFIIFIHFIYLSNSVVQIIFLLQWLKWVTFFYLIYSSSLLFYIRIPHYSTILCTFSNLNICILHFDILSKRWWCSSFYFSHQHSRLFFLLASILFSSYLTFEFLILFASFCLSSSLPHSFSFSLSLSVSLSLSLISLSLSLSLFLSFSLSLSLPLLTLYVICLLPLLPLRQVKDSLKEKLN